MSHAGRLTRDEAAARGRRVTGVDYSLLLRLGRDPDYTGEATLGFELLPGDGPLWIDFTGAELERLEVDGAPRAADWQDHRIQLAELEPGRHLVRVIYRNHYDSGGVGLHRFADPADGGVTLYTDFQPFNAHRVFPCFDQPDLKGAFRVAVEAPREWVVLAGAPVEAVEARGERALHRFAPTPPIPTYLCAVVAGDLACWEATPGDVPLRLFARRSLAAQLDPGPLFALTERGLRFFAAAFDHPFPFAKYDQVFVPELNASAMENVGLVTLNEQLIHRGRASRGDRLDRAETLLHELAHMWFGNLVTLRWWDDLWLNESFATFASYLALEADPEFDVEHVWSAFRAKLKRWALRQDALSTRHPVVGPVTDTDAVFLHFDGITYGKGAAALRQLQAYLGDAFLAGLRAYFRRHAWGCASLDDFLAALAEACGRDLDAWAAAWLARAGVNELQAELRSAAGRLESVRVVQRPAPGGVACPHRVRLTAWGGEPLAPTREVELLVEGAETPVPQLAGAPLPRLLTVDTADWTYAQVVLDPLSLDFARAELERLGSPLLKSQLWGSLWHMVRERRLGSLEFLALVERRLAAETEAEVVDAALEHARLALVLYVPEAARDAAQDRLVAAAWDGLARATDPELALVWLRQAVGSARAPQDLARLVRLADGQETPPQVALDQTLRWDLLTRLSAHAYPGVPERLAAERARDPSDAGRKSALGVEAAAPDVEVKRRFWQLFEARPTGWSDDALRAAMVRFHWPHQRALLGEFDARFFPAVSRLHAAGNLELTQGFFSHLFPPDPSPPLLARARAFLAETRAPQLARLTREALDELERAAACRSLQEQLGCEQEDA